MLDLPSVLKVISDDWLTRVDFPAGQTAAAVVVVTLDGEYRPSAKNQNTCG